MKREFRQDWKGFNAKNAKGHAKRREEGTLKTIESRFADIEKGIFGAAKDARNAKKSGGNLQFLRNLALCRPASACREGRNSLRPLETVEVGTARISHGGTKAQRDGTLKTIESPADIEKGIWKPQRTQENSQKPPISRNLALWRSG